MLPENMVTWHTECFKLKESEKWDGQDKLSDLPWNQILCLPIRGALPISGGKEYPYHRGHKGTERNLNAQSLLRAPQITALSSDSLS